jgi:cytoskeletal protein RodZ
MDKIGNLLKSRREELSLSLKDISSELKVRRYYLELIEDNKLNEVPSKVYTLGYLKLYAEHLGLDGDNLIKKFKDSTPTPNKEIKEEAYLENKTFSFDKESIILVITFFSIVSIIITYLLYYKHNVHSSLQNQTNEIHYILRDLEQSQTLGFKTDTTNMSSNILAPSLLPNLEASKIAIMAKYDTKIQIVNLEEARILEELVMKRGEVFFLPKQPHLIIKTPDRQSLEVITNSHQNKIESLDIKIIEEKF